jgi:hypothetical protein
MALPVDPVIFSLLGDNDSGKDMTTKGLRLISTIKFLAAEQTTILKGLKDLFERALPQKPQHSQQQIHKEHGAHPGALRCD